MPSDGILAAHDHRLEWVYLCLTWLNQAMTGDGHKLLHESHLLLGNDHALYRSWALRHAAVVANGYTQRTGKDRATCLFEARMRCWIGPRLGSENRYQLRFERVCSALEFSRPTSSSHHPLNRLACCLPPIEDGDRNQSLAVAGTVLPSSRKVLPKRRCDRRGTACRTGLWMISQSTGKGRNETLKLKVFAYRKTRSSIDGG